MELLGRNKEITLLEELAKSNKPEFMAVYGRRRVGKTFLIKQFFKTRKDTIFFNVTGSKGAPMHEQIENFTSRIGEVFYGVDHLKRQKNWRDTFKLLNETINNTNSNRKIVLFLDELPWLATQNSRLLENLDYFWNQYWSDNTKIKLIICGSSASWIINKIINNKAGLHNRLTKQLLLEPFNLKQTKLFLNGMGVKLDNKQVLKLYMVFGGIPYYLNEATPGLSAMEIIEKIAFSKNGFLLNEFDNLFSSLFNDYEAHVAIVRILAKHRYGIGKRKLLELIKSVGGTGTQKLQELEDAGFIMSFRPIYNKTRGTYYRLVDEYSFFYINWIEPIKSSLQAKALSKGNWQSIQSSPEWRSWMGYSFENTCYKHLAQIRAALSLQPNALPHSWKFSPKKYSKNKGAQIDLLFDRKDGMINMIEIKCTEKPFVITKDILNNLEQKVQVFREQTKTEKQIIFSIISANGLKKNSYSEDNINGVVELKDLFKEE